MSEQTVQVDEEQTKEIAQAQGSPMDYEGDFGSSAADAQMALLMDVTLQMSVELGRTQMRVRQILDLQKGSVIELDRAAGDPVDVYVNDHLIARGEVVVVDDNFGVRITELLSSKPGLGVA